MEERSMTPASQPASEPKLVVVVHWSYNIRGSSSSLSSSIQVKQRELGTQKRTKCLLLVVVCRSVSVAVGMWIPALFVCQCNRFKRFCMYRCVRCSSVLFLFQHCWVSQIAVPQNLFRFSSFEDNFCRQTPTHSKHSCDASVVVFVAALRYIWQCVRTIDGSIHAFVTIFLLIIVYLVRGCFCSPLLLLFESRWKSVLITLVTYASYEADEQTNLQL